METDQPTVLTRIRRLVVAALAFGSVAVEFHGGPELYFSYFTVLTNLAIGAWFVGAALARRPQGWSTLRLALTVYGLVTLIVYWVFLSPTHHPAGASFFANLGLHLVVPLAMAFEDWVSPWPRVGLRAGWLVMVWPLVYCAGSLVRGQITGWYPYFFLNPGPMGGWAALVAFVGLLLVLFVALAFGWRWVIHRRQTK